MKFTVLKIAGYVIILFLLGCVGSMNASNFELKNLKENEGIIIGSYLANIKGGRSNKYVQRSLWTYIGVKKLSDIKFEITMEKDSINFLTTRLMYKDNVSPGKEYVFIKNLSEGTYYIDTVQKTGDVILPTLLKIRDGRAKIKVKRGKVTYIGRLVVNIGPGGRLGSGGGLGQGRGLGGRSFLFQSFGPGDRLISGFFETGRRFVPRRRFGSGRRFESAGGFPIGGRSRKALHGRLGKFDLRVEDEQEKSLAYLKKDYAEILSNVEKKLMIISD